MGVPGGIRGACCAAACCWAVALGASAGGSEGASAVQRCDTSVYARSTSADRFTDLGGGSLADRRLGLVWLRCALGQVWSQGTCEGRPVALNWSEARQAAARLNADGREFFDNWRLPRMNELASIVEHQCDNPRIDLGLFPGTPADYFWSATPMSASDGTVAYVLSFGADGAGHDATDARHFVRLVRYGP